MANWKTRGRRLYLAASHRKGGDVKTRYLRSWGSVQEALVDLSDVNVLVALKRKTKNLDVAKLVVELNTPGKFPKVPRYAATALQLVTGHATWNGVVEWDLGRDFWRRLTDSLIAKIGLAALDGLAYGLTLDARDAVLAYRIDVEAATRDLQRRLLRHRRRAQERGSTAGPNRAELRDAMETLGLAGPIEKLTRSDVQKRYRLAVQHAHPDKGGHRDQFERFTAARDLLLAHLNIRGRG